MILRNRRSRFLYVALAAMDVACLLPYVLTWIFRARRWDESSLPAFTADVVAQPLALFAFGWLTMVGYMLVIDLINRRKLDSPRREIAIIALVLATSIAGARLFLYPLSEPADMDWVGDIGNSIAHFAEGVTPPLLLLLVNTFLWIRVAMASDREISFLGVGVSFRLGMLLSLIGGALVSTIGGQPPSVALLYFVLFFGFGLVAMALARIDEKAVGDTGNPGAVVPYSRLAEILALIALILGGALGAQRFLSPGSIRAGVAVFDPLWRVIGQVLGTLLLAIFLLIGPLLERLVLFLERMASDVEPPQATLEPPVPVDFAGVEQMMREWTLVRYCFIIGVFVAVLAILWFFFVQPRDEADAAEGEDEQAPETRSGIAPGMPNLDRLRNWLNMLRRYGMGRRLLNAISVENMYANLSRLARTRGFARLPSQPPDAYLPQLEKAFPGQLSRLERMTMAYMRVHYGDLDVEPDELAALREDYDIIVETPPAQPSP